MTGPFDFLTTLRSGESETLGGGAVAAFVFSSAVRTRPVITDAEPTTALRMRNVRRSTPGGASSRSDGDGVLSSGFADFMSTPWRAAVVRGRPWRLRSQRWARGPEEGSSRGVSYGCIHRRR